MPEKEQTTYDTEKDSYYKFMESFEINEEEFIAWGFDAIYFPPKEIVDYQWEKLKERIESKKEVMAIRGYGRNGGGTSLYQDFYKDYFGITIKSDGTNNQAPQSLMEMMTGSVRNVYIFNYQVSHIWAGQRIYICSQPRGMYYLSLG